jgi:outer membrane protein TolC
MQAYRSAPLASQATAAQLETRSLDDPALHIWMRQAADYTAPVWPLTHWDLNSLTLAAYYFNPSLDVARAHATQASAAIQTAAMKPNPSVSIGPGYETTPGSPFMFGFDFSLPIETAGKRGYRIAEAQHLSEASRVQIADTAWNVRSGVRAALANYVFAAQTAVILRTQEARQSQYVQLLEARHRAGEIALPELTQPRIDLTTVRQVLRTAEGQVSVAHASLAAAIGIPESALNSKTIEWSEADSPPPPGTLSVAGLRAAAIENRLDVQRDLANYEAAQSALQLEIARQYPDIDLGPGYAFEEGSHMISLVLGAALPLRNRNQGPIAQALAARKAAGAQLLATQSAVMAGADEALAQYRAAWAELQEARQAATQTQQQSRTAAAWSKAGESDQLSALAAELQFSVADRARIDALRQTQLALGSLEDALQRPLSPDAAPPLPQAGLRQEVLR